MAAGIAGEGRRTDWLTLRPLHLAGPGQTASVREPNWRIPRQGEPGSSHGAGRETGCGKRFPRAQHENGRPDTHRIPQGKLHPNSRWQGMIAQQGAIGALEILDLDHPTFHIQAAVVTRSQGIFDPDVSLSAAADLQNPLCGRAIALNPSGPTTIRKSPSWPLSAAGKRTVVRIPPGLAALSLS